MANPEHVALIKSGAPAVREWRLRNPDVYLDLSQDSDFDYIELYGVDLHHTNFSNATLSAYDPMGIAFSGSNLAEAKFSKAHLTGIDFSRCNLSNADFSSAILKYVSLNHANLSDADFLNAILDDSVYFDRDTDFSGATFGNTAILGCDLSQPKGLKTVKHVAGSRIDLNTLIASCSGAGGSIKGELLDFFRGAGVPKILLDSIPKMLQENPIQFYSCFISYSTKDQEFADLLHADLLNEGVRCWFYPRDRRIGDKILDTVHEAIRVRDKVLLILSESAIASDWVEDEVTKAFEEERRRKQTVLFPIRLDDAVMNVDVAWASKVRARDIGDFRHWKDHDAYKNAFKQALRDLTMEANAEGLPSAREVK